MWSNGNSKQNKQWIWLAIDVDSREMVGVFIGDRSRQSAKQLWQSLPGIYRQCATAVLSWAKYSNSNV